MEPAGTLERGLSVLRAIAADPRRPARATDLVRATGLARSTVDRVLGTLVHLGYLRAEGRDVVLAPRLMELGEAYLSGSGLRDAVAGPAARLADRLDESVSVAVRDGDGVRFIAQFTRRRRMSVTFRVGDVLPASRCAAGLAFLDPAKEWAEDDQLIEPGLIAIAVPVRTPPGAGGSPGPGNAHGRSAAPGPDGADRRSAAAAPGGAHGSGEPGDGDGAAGEAVCAVSVVSHTSRHTVAELREHCLPALRETVAEMEAALATLTTAPDTTAPSTTAPAAAVSRAARSAPAAPATSAASDKPDKPGTPAASDKPDTRAEAAASDKPDTRAEAAASDEPAVSGPRAHPATPLPRPGVDPAKEAKRELGMGFLQSLARGLAVMVALGTARGGVTLADAAKVTGLPRATVRRAVQALERLGYAAARGSRFTLLPRVLELGYAHLSGLTFREIVQPHLADLAARVNESASVAVLDGDDVVYVARVQTVSLMSVNITVGTRFPAYATSMGRVLLAEQPDERLAAIEPRRLAARTVTSKDELRSLIRQAAADGYALVDQELEEGVRSIAVPIRDRTGRTVAAVNVATHAGRFGNDALIRDVLPALREAAARMEADLAYTGAVAAE